MTTTSYGSWLNRGGSTFSVEQFVQQTLDNPADYDTDAIEGDLREEVNSRLPEGVTLAGNEFYGPHGQDVDFDLAEILEDIDYWGIVARNVK
jgi:hypothetical protein